MPDTISQSHEEGTLSSYYSQQRTGRPEHSRGCSESPGEMGTEVGGRTADPQETIGGMASARGSCCGPRCTQPELWARAWLGRPPVPALPVLPGARTPGAGDALARVATAATGGRGFLLPRESLASRPLGDRAGCGTRCSRLCRTSGVWKDVEPPGLQSAMHTRALCAKCRRRLDAERPGTFVLRNFASRSRVWGPHPHSVQTRKTVSEFSVAPFKSCRFFRERGLSTEEM
ncbi:uncharacterized protein LOC123631429 [Lemur catta]|uniref:uncharacterized protein LOC123631429 n=1 Tax=Lemur catta TaxID=9447 RepID=UPI001E269AB0|nr:uncharacterized protein LOC123631429 [Lemur catta]